MDKREPLNPQKGFNGYGTPSGREEKTANYTDNELLYDIAQSLRHIIKELERPTIVVKNPR